MKYIYALFIALVLFGCQSVNNQDPVDEYISTHKKNGWTISIRPIGDDVIAAYKNKIPDYEKLKSDLKQASQKVWEIVKADSEYQVVQKAYMELGSEITEEQQKEYDARMVQIDLRLWKNEKYANAQKEGGKKKALFNMTVYEYIVNDYRSKGLDIPKSWYQKEDGSFLY